MARATPRLILFPGLGVDGRLFEVNCNLPAQIETFAWPDPYEQETVQTYSRRLARSLDPFGPLYLGGVSFGAMVALEAAAILRPRAIFAISICQTPRDIAPYIRAGAAVARHTPDALLPIGRLMSPVALRLLGRFNRKQRRLLVQLFQTANYRLFRWAARTIPHWTWPTDVPCPVYHIHGTADLIVPIENVRPDQSVPEAGHFLNLTHPAELHQFIASRL